MKLLEEMLLDPGTRELVAEDCARLVESEIAGKKGVSGMVVKTGFKAFSAAKPGIVRQAVNSLLEDFVGALSPHYADYVQSGAKGSFQMFLTGRAGRVTEDFLRITDTMAERTDNKALRTTYSGLRRVARKHVEEAVPGVGAIVDKHTGNTGG
jgi:hypothetical protein